MMKIVILCFVAVVWFQLATEGDAVCCREYNPGYFLRKVCYDCGQGGPYCGVGDCNIFGCNCDGGCRQGDCSPTYRGKRHAVVRIEDAHDVIRAADVDGDGRMSLEEARLHLANEGVPADHVKRSLVKMDADNDNYLSPWEIDLLN